jgi:hypothetical protein
MKYMLLTYLEEKVWLALSPERQRAEMASCAPLIRKLIDDKKLLAGSPLHATTAATTVRYRDGKRLITDGPFAETREQLGGYTILEANDLDEAIAVATGIIGTSTMATIEVRPILDLGGDVPPAPERGQS